LQKERVYYNSMSLIDELKAKDKLTRVDIAQLLESIGKPGEKQDEKLKAIKELNISNSQGHGLETTLDGYGEF